MRRAGLVVIAAVLGCSSCGKDAATSPSQVSSPVLQINCPVPADSNVLCRAEKPDGDVTNTALWTVIPADGGVFTAPGVFRPSRRGEVTIQAAASGLTSQSLKFFVDPVEAARWMWFGSFVVRESESQAPIPNALITIVTGYKAGKTCVTISDGSCAIDDLLTFEEFTVSAFRKGYRLETVLRTAYPPLDPYKPALDPILLSKN